MVSSPPGNGIYGDALVIKLLSWNLRAASCVIGFDVGPRSAHAFVHHQDHDATLMVRINANQTKRYVVYNFSLLFYITWRQRFIESCCRLLSFSLTRINMAITWFVSPHQFPVVLSTKRVVFLPFWSGFEVLLAQAIKC